MALEHEDVIKVVVDIDGPDLVICQNVFHWQLDDSAADEPTDAQVITAIDQKLTTMYETVDQLIHSDYSFDEAVVDKVEWDVDHWGVVENLGVADISVAGTSVAGSAPHVVAVVLTGYTDQPKSRARKFLPGFSEGEMANSTLSGTVLTALALLAIEWLDPKTVVGTAVLEPVITGTGATSAGLILPIISLAANAITGSQRKRKPGVGS